MLLFVFILIIIFDKTNSCICPQNTSTREIYKFNVNSSFGQEWWYFLHNVIDKNSPILSVENVWLRKKMTGVMELVFIFIKIQFYIKTAL